MTITLAILSMSLSFILGFLVCGMLIAFKIKKHQQKIQLTYKELVNCQEKISQIQAILWGGRSA